MRYIRVRWIHDFSDEPEFFFHEVGDDYYERRRVEVFSNGKKLFTDGSKFSSNMKHPHLSPVQIIDLKEINNQIEFEANEISKTDFEEIWNKAIDNKECNFNE